MHFCTVVTVSVFALAQATIAYPNYGHLKPRQTVGNLTDGFGGRIISFPAPDPDNGLKQIPDAAHPFIAPGLEDLRGPCPALNTLANHGYLPRNGVATPEQIFTAVTEGFNMGPTFAQFLISTATLARGNPYLGLLSIGGESPSIPALPGQVDGSAPPGGIAKHGRFEGDLSSTREDADIGDHINFQLGLFDDFLSYVAEYGDDDVTGNRTVVTEEVMANFKKGSFAMFQQIDPGFTLHIARQLTVFSEVSFMLNFFANGTDGKLDVDTLTSIFEDQQFPTNFYRRSSPAELDVISGNASQVMNAIYPPIMPGQNINGQYVLDEPPFTNFLCDAYTDIVTNNIPRTYLSTTGILQQNVQTLLNAIYKPFHDIAGCPVQATPNGDPGV